jgi:malonate transporter
MSAILSITAPIYLLIALGYAAVRCGLIGASQLPALGRFVVLFCLPALLLQALTARPLGAVMAWGFLWVYLGGSLLAALLIFAYAYGLRGQTVARALLWAMAGTVSNSAFIGYPVMRASIGEQAGITLAMCMLVENLVMMPLALALIDGLASPAGWRAAVRHTGRSLLRNPMLIAIALGLALGVLEWSPPALLQRVLQMLAVVASPLALFVVGGSLVGLQLRGMLRDAAELAALKLLLHPLAVWLLLSLLPPLEPAMRSAALVIAAMPLASIVPVLGQRHGAGDFLAAVLMLATLASFGSLMLWLLLV